MVARKGEKKAPPSRKKGAAAGGKRKQAKPKKASQEEEEPEYDDAIIDLSADDEEEPAVKEAVVDLASGVKKGRRRKKATKAERVAVADEEASDASVSEHTGPPPKKKGKHNVQLEDEAEAEDTPDDHQLLKEDPDTPTKLLKQPQKDAIINFVREHSELYDVEHEDFPNKPHKDRLWDTQAKVWGCLPKPLSGGSPLPGQHMVE